MPSIINEKKEELFLNIFSKFKIFSLSFVVLLLLFSFIFMGLLAQHSVFAQSDYRLPYPGILPNHPLYVLKVIRDRALETFTREPSKKAQLYLLFADKRLFMAQMIFDKDWKSTADVTSKAEKYLLKTRDSIEESKKIGVSPEVGFMSRTIESSKKHQEVIIDLIKHAPGEYKSNFNASLKLNKEFRDWLKTQK